MPTSEKRILADYHVHTYFSDDSKCPTEEMLKHAISMGLSEIAFAEHVNYGVKNASNCDYPRYFKELARLEEKYGGQIKIVKGIEFGIQLHTIPQFEDDFKHYPFDFVILSNHQVENQEFWNYEFQEGKTQDEFQRAYYEAIYDLVRNYKNYSVLGHLDMIKRYDPIGRYPDERIMDIVREILSQAISDGKGIEVNTSCFHYGLPDLTPSRKILELYHSLGGNIITIGSDAHETKYLGDKIVEVREILKEIGFRYYCTFDKMEPTFCSLG